MRKLSIVIWIVLCAIAICLPTEAEAQRRRGTKKRPEKRVEAPSKSQEEEVPFWDRLWYGGNFALGFGGNQFSSQFLVQLAPAVGYKITPAWSVGPRIELSYLDWRQTVGNNSVVRNGSFDVGGFAFMRYKIAFGIFAHVESGIRTVPLRGFNNGEPVIIKELQNPIFVGLGYNTGGGEILFVYDVNAPTNSLVQPYEIRFGFTVGF